MAMSKHSGAESPRDLHKRAADAELRPSGIVLTLEDLKAIGNGLKADEPKLFDKDMPEIFSLLTGAVCPEGQGSIAVWLLTVLTEPDAQERVRACDGAPGEHQRRAMRCRRLRLQ
mmetsp:Transcript_86957/g.246524  ORF Transcript_86957/g.246524 Transcript_86957/m.246524 type:complete len:115 (+) Transcript_86957:89-433(+)